MKRRPIHRGGILSAGYDARARHLDVEFDTHRLVRVENIGPEAGGPLSQLRARPAATGATSSRRGYTIREISQAEGDAPAAGKNGHG